MSVAEFFVCLHLEICSDETTQEKDGITVVTTIFPVYDWPCNIAGDNCNVIYLDESGTDMHSFEPTAKDILTLAQADVFIHIGGVSDEWVEGAIESADNPELKHFHSWM